MIKTHGRKILYIVVYKNGEHGKPNSFYLNCNHEHDATRLFRKINGNIHTRILYIKRAEAIK